MRLVRLFGWILLGFAPLVCNAWSDADEERLRTLALELRCLVCQNQSIADSHAPLAVDLRRQVREMMEAGRSDDDIRDYMTARYGDFVLYRPPMKPLTWALWFGPFVLLGLGVLLALRMRQKAPENLPPTDGAKIRALLEEKL